MRTRGRLVGALAAVAWLGTVGCVGQGAGRPSGAAGNTGTAGTSIVGTGGSTITGTAGVGMSGCAALPPIPRRLWRLSAEQYGRAVKDLLGLTTAPVLTNRGGEAAYAFFSDASLGVDENFQFALYQASQDVLAQIVPRIATIAPCAGTTPAAQTACATTFAQTFGAKAFRRPLDASEVTNLMKVYAQAAVQDYATGIAQMIQARHHRAVVRVSNGAGAVDVDRRRDRQVSRHDAHAVRGRDPARLSVPRLHAR